MMKIYVKRLRSVYTVDDQPVVDIPLADLMDSKADWSSRCKKTAGTIK